MNRSPQHIVTGYDTDLNRLTAALSELGGLVEGMVADGVTSLKTRDTVLAGEVIDRDRFANRLQAQIDDDAMRILALRNPMATDLRRTVGAIRVAADLERIGDLAEGIAKRARNIAAHPPSDATAGVVRMGLQVKTQLSKGLDAFLREDAAAAMQVWMADEDVDALYNSLLRELLTFMMSDPAQINGATALLFSAKNLERIGDHVSNICETIYFTQNGRQLIEDDAVQQLIKSTG